VFGTIEKENVKFVRLQFVDINGTVKNMAVPSKNVEGIIEDGIMFDGSSVDGYGRIQESDMMLRPDLSTFSILPWSTGNKHTGRIICDVYEKDGKKPFAGDPRFVLKRSIEYMKETLGKDMVFNVGPELEFYLLKKTDCGLVPHDTGGYFDYSPLDLAEDVRKDSALAMMEMGIDFEVEHHEVRRRAFGRRPGHHLQDHRQDDIQHVRHRSHLHAQAVHRQGRKRHAHQPVDLRYEQGKEHLLRGR
jgi:glutamine synthetase